MKSLFIANSSKIKVPLPLKKKDQLLAFIKKNTTATKHSWPAKSAENFGRKLIPSDGLTFSPSLSGFRVVR